MVLLCALHYAQHLPTYSLDASISNCFLQTTRSVKLLGKKPDENVRVFIPYEKEFDESVSQAILKCKLIY